jgi:uncharacterized ubiquitin-like protein YukD
LAIKGDEEMPADFKLRFNANRPQLKKFSTRSPEVKALLAFIDAVEEKNQVQIKKEKANVIRTFGKKSLIGLAVEFL